MRPEQLRLAFAAAGTVAVLAFTEVPASAVTTPDASLPEATQESLAQIAEDYLQQRADMLTTRSPTLRAAVAHIKATRTMAAQTQDDLAALAAKGERYETVDGGYTKAQVEVSVTDATVNGTRATLQLTESTRLFLPFTQEEIDDGAPEYEELSLPHTVEFTKAEDGTWLLASDNAHTEGGPTPTTQVSDVNAEPETTDEEGPADENEGSKGGGSSITPSGGAETGSGTIKPDASVLYSYSKMIAYADKHWKNHNPAFRTYSGNDCTNFLSQIVHAGGWKPAGGSLIQRTSNKYWFYGPANAITSYTWGGAEN